MILTPWNFGRPGGPKWEPKIYKNYFRIVLNTFFKLTWEVQKTPNIDAKTGKEKWEAQSKKNKGQNLNPLAPAQSKRTFAFSGKTRNSIGNASISAPFFSPFLYLFRAFSRKVEHGVQGLAPKP